MNPLTDLLPARWRKWIYAVLALVMILASAWQASDGDWTVFAVTVLAALGFGQAHGNTSDEGGK